MILKPRLPSEYYDFRHQLNEIEWMVYKKVESDDAILDMLHSMGYAPQGAMNALRLMKDTPKKLQKELYLEPRQLRRLEHKYLDKEGKPKKRRHCNES